MINKTILHEATIGTDSEFICVNPETNRAVTLDNYFDKEGDYGYDDNGKHQSGEVRSLPSKDPLRVSRSIKEIFQRLLNENPEFDNFIWHGGSFIKGLPIGSHLHVSHTKNVVDIEGFVAPILDDYYGSLSILLEDRKQGLKRRSYHTTPGGNKVQYGDISDIRFIEHGRLDRYEYRSCSCFLGSMEICTAFLCLGKVLIIECLNNPSLRYKGYVNSEDFLGMNTKKIYSLFPHIWSEIQGMILYKKYAKHLQIIHDLIIAKECWTPKNIDIKAAWGLKLDENCISKPVFRARKILKSKFDIVPNEGDFIKIPEFFPAPKISLAQYLRNSEIKYKNDIDNTDVLKPNIDIVKTVLKRAKKVKGLTVTKKHDYWPDDFLLTLT